MYFEKTMISTVLYSLAIILYVARQVIATHKITNYLVPVITFVVHNLVKDCGVNVSNLYFHTVELVPKTVSWTVHNCGKKSQCNYQ